MKAKIVVKYTDLIIIHYPHQPDRSFIECKVCGGVSDVGIECRGIVHRDDCVVDRWELKQTVADAKRGNFGGYAGGYRHTPVNPLAIWERTKAKLGWKKDAHG